MTFFFTFSKLFQKVQIPLIVKATDIYFKRNQTFFSMNNQFQCMNLFANLLTSGSNIGQRITLRWIQNNKISKKTSCYISPVPLGQALWVAGEGQSYCF